MPAPPDFPSPNRSCPGSMKKVRGCRAILIDGSSLDAFLKDGESGVCIDVSGGSLSQNATLIFDTCHGATSQQWWNNG